MRLRPESGTSGRVFLCPPSPTRSFARERDRSWLVNRFETPFIRNHFGGGLPCLRIHDGSMATLLCGTVGRDINPEQ